MKCAQGLKYTLMMTASCAFMMSFSASKVQAQSIDYSAMEKLFGEPVTTSGNGSPQRVSDVALNMDILSADEIKRTGAKSIPEALRYLPGIDVRRHSYGQYEVGIRGYNQASSERILVLVNGRQVYTDFFGQVVWGNIPVEMSDIKQIEVVKGPNTALFGFNAVSGVINIITHNPLYDDVKEISVRGGTQGYKAVSGTVTHKFANNNVAVRLSGNADKADDEFDDIKNPSGLVSNPTLDDTKTVSGSIDLWAQLADNIQGQIELTKNNHVRNEYLVMHALATTEYDTYSARSRILADTSLGLIEADLYHNETLADYGIHLSSGTLPLQADNRITVAKLNDTLEIGSEHIIRLAGEYRSASNIFSSSAADLDQSDLTYDIASASALWDWKLTDKIRTSAAVRYDYFEMDPDEETFIASGTIGTLNPSADSDYHQVREEVGYNLGATYKIDDFNTVKLSHARGADLPSFTEMGLQFFSTSAAASSQAIYGDPNTDTSIVTNYEIGYDKVLNDIDGLFHSSIFYQESNEMQAFQSVVTNSGGVDISIIGNIGDSKMYGIELGLEGLYDNHWDWDVNYSYVHITDDLRNAQNSAERSSVATYEDSTPSHILNAHIGYLGQGWRADLFGQYKSKFQDVFVIDHTSNNEYALSEVNDQIIVNANFAYDLTDYLTWSVSGTSITSQTQQAVESDAEQTLWSSLTFRF